jgi:hypothetical protein
MNLLNRAVYGAAFRRYGKRLRVLPVLEKGEVRARSLRPWERGTSGRWHIHCAIELPSHFDAVALESLICDCWAKVEWGHGRILVRDGANAGWITYMLKDRQSRRIAVRRRRRSGRIIIISLAPMMLHLTQALPSRTDAQ